MLRIKNILFIILFFVLSTKSQGQSDRISEWRESRVPHETRMQQSKIWKLTGFTLLATGLYLNVSNNNPQRIDIPLIGFGTLITLEGIRLRKQVNNPRRETIF